MRGREQMAHLGHDLHLGEKEVLIGHQGRFFVCKLWWHGHQSARRMLKKSASGVLASLRSSTYRSVRLAYSLTAALLDGHFEHPASRSCASTPPYDHSGT